MKTAIDRKPKNAGENRKVSSTTAAQIDPQAATQTLAQLQSQENILEESDEKPLLIVIADEITSTSSGKKTI